MKKFIIALGFLYSATTLADSALNFDNKKMTLNNLQPQYKVVINYPQIKNPTSPSQIKFNQIAKTTALSQLKDFKESVSENLKYPIPEDLKAEGSTLTLTYDLTSLEPAQLVSVRFSNDTSFVGAAHPSHKYSALNYDLTQNKIADLSYLFKNENTGLKQLAQIATKRVTDQLNHSSNGPNVDIFNEGLTPTNKNYQVWNLTPDGIQVTFNEYQVAAYVYGPQTITIKFDELKNQLNPNTTLAKCLTNKNCDIKIFTPNSQ